MTARTLLVISASVRAAEEATAAGRWPRKDFLQLRRALNADVVDYDTVNSSRYRVMRRLAGMPVTQAWIAFQARGRYEQIFTDGEHIGLPLAALLRFARRRPRHVTIGHLLSTWSKKLTFRRLRLGSGIDAILLHATAQRDRAEQELGPTVPSLPLVPYQVDTEFWSPAGGEPDDLICTAGLEYRDYPALVAAVRNLPVRTVIAAGSRWSTHRSAIGAGLPANVEVVSLDYLGLRDLYARARIVVVPLREIDNQAGITTILEAMAMAKPVIVTATTGQRDVVRGRLWTAAGPSDRLIGGPAAFGVDSDAGEAETGLYVPPGDPAALRTAIRHLLDHPAEAAVMGTAGRRLVEEWMNLDAFTRRVAAIITANADAVSRGEARQTMADSFAIGK